MTDDLVLSPHFLLHELLQSQTATRNEVHEQFEPGEEIIENLKYLCNNLLEQIRVLNDNRPLHINSGYRCPRLNALVKGASTSQHLFGQAADIDLGSNKANMIFFEKIKNSGLVFDQLINEFNGSWVHVSLKKADNRQMVLNVTK
jgi:zinc D-Ala-D-Ala carboxypeptidase